MAETPQQPPTQIDHNIRIVYMITGEHVICNFGQIREPVDGEEIAGQRRSEGTRAPIAQ